MEGKGKAKLVFGIEKSTLKQSKIKNRKIINGTKNLLILSKTKNPFFKMSAQKTITSIRKTNFGTPWLATSCKQPNIADENIMQIERFIARNNFDERTFEITEEPIESKNLNKKKNKKKESAMPRYDHSPKRVKKTAISFPLKKPQPSTEPTMVKKIPNFAIRYLINFMFV